MKNLKVTNYLFLTLFITAFLNYLQSSTGLMLKLTELPGVGDSIANKLIEILGSKEEVERILDEGDVSTLSSIDGISLQRAVKLINAKNGNLKEITCTDESRKLHSDLIEQISKYVETNAGKSRLSIMSPLTRSSLNLIKIRQNWATESMCFIVNNINFQQKWINSISVLSQTIQPNTRIDRVIVIPDASLLDSLNQVSKRCRVIVRSPNETWNDYLGLNKVTWIGPNAPNESPPGWVISKINDSLNSMVPEIPLEWLKLNYSNLSILSELSDIEWPVNYIGEKIGEALNGLDNLPLILESMKNESNQLEILEKIRDGLWAEVKSIEGSVNDAIVSGTSDASMSFEGNEVLSYYSDISSLEMRLKRVVADSMEQPLELGKIRLSDYLNKTGINIPFEIYSNDYPCIINREILDVIENKLDSAILSERSTGEIMLANSTQKIINLSNIAISNCIEIDMWLGIGKWAIENRCTMPNIFTNHPGIWVRDARHLLLDCEPDPITYGLGEISIQGDRDRIALLSGANSGGKTTLLETLGMITILAHCGLPIPASESKIGLLDEIHMLAKVSGTQSAGALERTLRRLAEILVSNKRKLILADELEAITEPGSAALILGGLLSASNNNLDTNVLLVTHIGPSIRNIMGDKVRIDGIEAQGLDENMDLIVDRTPKRNHIARSTPELIVRRLAARSSGPTEKIFSGLLKIF